MTAAPAQDGRLDFLLKSFDELTIHEFHDLIRLRVDVFVVEQQCPYPELDGRDQRARHLLGYLERQLVAYARWYPREDATVLGRIVTRGDLRRQGLGRAVMAKVLRMIGDREIRISAQSQLEGFYRDLGFETVSRPYDDFGIPHIDMVRAPESRSL